jgi:hypothetical protein
MNWKRVTGVLCDKKMNLSIKGKVYKSVESYRVERMEMRGRKGRGRPKKRWKIGFHLLNKRPAMMYGAETWAMKKVGPFQAALLCTSCLVKFFSLIFFKNFFHSIFDSHKPSTFSLASLALFSPSLPFSQFFSLCISHLFVLLQHLLLLPSLFLFTYGRYLQNGCVTNLNLQAVWRVLLT